MPPQHHALIGNRYQLLDLIGSGGMGAVYHAHDRLMDTSVALKQVTIPKEQLVTNSVPDPTKQSHIALASEFRTLASLRHPHIISVLDYGFDESQYPYFTMELLDSAQPITTVAGGLDTDVKWQLIIQMLQALAYLHRRGILHRDLKPDNVLVRESEPGCYQVKVLDFGLAVAHDYTDESETIVGTLAYVAPELLQMESATRESDLYAVGMMMYEILAGQYPFDMVSVTDLMQSILYSRPNVRIDGIERPVGSILKRLLQKSPQNRYATAELTISAVAEATQIELDVESVAVRESFLQSAQFVGRDAEFEELQDALLDAKQSYGSLWLIEGESGVGKSRLLDELRTVALVEGVTVLSGQAVSDGGLPYEVWRDVLRRLILSVDVTDEQAGILKEIVPDIDRLLNRPVDLAPILSEAAQKERLMDVIAQVIASQPNTMLLLMEDLHWALDSLEPIVQLADKVADMPLCIIGSYRSDENPDLTETLPTAKTMTLNRLIHEEIVALSVSMVGEAAHQPGVIDLVERETEGNTFFIVEVMRALAEDAGQLDNIGRVTLPASVVTGGMNAVIERRLKRIPESYQPLLAVGAVAGRRLDLSLLSYVLDHMEIEESFTLDAWLSACDTAAVMTVRDDQWQFSHDKLREYLLQNLDDERHIHEMVAQALEAVYPDDMQRYPSLAHHWLEADNLPKAIDYGIPATKLMKNVSQYREAIDLLYNIYTRWNQEDVPPAVQCDFFIRLGELHERTGDNKIARGYFERSLPIAEQLDDIGRQADTLLGLGLVDYNMGDFETSLASTRKALEIGEGVASNETIAQIYKVISNIYSKRDEFAKSNEYIHKVLEISREHDFKIEIAGGLNNLGVNAYLMGNHADARSYYEQALEVYQEVGYRSGIALSLGNLGDVTYEDGLATQLDYYQQALAIHRDIGNQWGVALCLENSAMTYFMAGQLQEAMTSFTESLQIARKIEDKFGTQHLLMELGFVNSYMGEFETASAYFEESLKLAQELELGLNLVSCLAYSAWHYVNMGEVDEGKKRLLKAVDLLPTIESPFAKLDVLASYASLTFAEGDRERSLLIAIRLNQDFNLDDSMSEVVIKPLLAELKALVAEPDYRRIHSQADTLTIETALEMVSNHLRGRDESEANNATTGC